MWGLIWEVSCLRPIVSKKNSPSKNWWMKLMSSVSAPGQTLPIRHCLDTQAAVATGATDEWHIPPWPWAISSWLASPLEHFQEDDMKWPFKVTKIFFLPSPSERTMFVANPPYDDPCFGFQLAMTPLVVLSFQVGLPGSLWWLLGGECD